MGYSPLKVSQFLSPPKARKQNKSLRPTRKHKPRALSLPKSHGLSLVDEPDPANEIAESILIAINGVVSDAQSDKEILDDQEGNQGRSKVRCLPMRSSKSKEKGIIPIPTNEDTYMECERDGKALHTK